MTQKVSLGFNDFDYTVADRVTTLEPWGFVGKGKKWCMDR